MALSARGAELWPPALCTMSWKFAETFSAPTSDWYCGLPLASSSCPPPSSLFNAVVRTMSRMKIHDFNCGFKVYRAEVTRELPLYGELHRYIPVLAHNRGFRVAEAKVRHRARRYGKSKFGGTRFARGFFDLITVLFLTQYTLRPLHFFGWFGISTFTLGFIINAYLATLWFMGQPIGTRPLLTLGVLLMIIGGQFFVFGLLAEMIASTTHRSAGYSVRRHLHRTYSDQVDRQNAGN
jgi:hypothetical protein